MKKILLIGGCGYIGSRLYEYLKTTKNDVTTVDYEMFGNFVNPQNINTNYRVLSKSFISKFDTIIVLSGFSSVKMHIGRVKKAFVNDVESFVYLLDKITDQRLIYASSSSIYGTNGNVKATEKYTAYSPLNHYDLNKKIMDYYAQLSGLDYYGLRLGTVCGYSPQLRIDLMINKMYHTARQFGVITVISPEMNRPVLGINDLCRAVGKIIAGKKNPGIYNVASFNASVRDISNEVKRHIGKVNIVVKEINSLYNFSVDTTKFQKTYNFEFKETVKSIVNSLKEGYGKANKTVRE